VELLDVDPDDREAFTCSGSQRSGSTAPPAKRANVDHKSKLVEIARERLEEQRAQTEILSRMADSQANSSELAVNKADSTSDFAVGKLFILVWQNPL